MPTVGTQDIKHEKRFQSIRVKKSAVKNKDEAVKVVKDLGYKTGYLDVSPNEYRFRQMDPVPSWPKATVHLTEGVTAIYEHKPKAGAKPKAVTNVTRSKAKSIAAAETKRVLPPWFAGKLKKAVDKAGPKTGNKNSKKKKPSKSEIRTRAVKTATASKIRSLSAGGAE